MTHTERCFAAIDPRSARSWRGWPRWAPLLVPAMIAACFLFPGDGTDWMMYRLSHTGRRGDARRFRCSIAPARWCWASIPTGFVVWALWSLRRLFLLYAHGEVFSESALKAPEPRRRRLVLERDHGIRHAGASISGAHLAKCPGHREISLGFGSDDVSSLFMAGVVLVIARVMAEARRVADENASFV